jgi:hypothetical protein
MGASSLRPQEGLVAMALLTAGQDHVDCRHAEVVSGKALCQRILAASLAPLCLYLYCPSSLDYDLEESCISELRRFEMYARRTARRLL